jgi:hypothetical protein
MILPLLKQKGIPTMQRAAEVLYLGPASKENLMSL